MSAASASLLDGAGDGVIHRKGGPAIFEACWRLRAERSPDGLPTGQAAAMPAGRLLFRRVTEVRFVLFYSEAHAAFERALVGRRPSPVA